MTELALTLTTEPDYINAKKQCRRKPLENRQQLNDFLASVERRAFQIARLATNNPDDALELVQEAMMKLVEKYHHKPDNEWTPLFYRILNSKINDWYRKQSLRNRWFVWWNKISPKDWGSVDLIENSAAPNSSPANSAQQSEATRQLLIELKALSPRQQQAFLLRAWEGMSIEETAFAMGCSEGSVKTHYSRAVHALRDQLEEFY